MPNSTYRPDLMGHARLEPTGSCEAGSWQSFTLTYDAENRLVVGGRWRGTGASGKSYDEPGLAFVTDVEPVATISGTAVEIYRWLWGRGPEPATSGDAESLDAVRTAQAQGMQ